MEQVFEYEYNGYSAYVIRPEKPNGKWIWKTEFFTAFDQAERALLDMGYTRVYYQISDKYGSFNAVRLMHNFYFDVINRFNLDERCYLFGFSRGGLYAFNFTLFYPECVEKIYFDAPVLDLRTWPKEGMIERVQAINEYGLTPDAYETFNGQPVNYFDEFFSHMKHILLIAGLKDEEVDFSQNAGKMIDYCKEHNIYIETILKPEGKHHPHSLEDVTPIINFIERG